ncbi:C40 family peptidase, partial [Mycolicibacterium sphagni]
GALGNLFSGAGRQSQSGGGPEGAELAGMVRPGDGGGKGDQIVRNALTQLGVPYEWGGEKPGKGMDCSGLVQWAYQKAGISIPRTTYTMTDWGVRVPPNQAQPGDILLCNRRDGAWQHVMLVMNDHQTVEAPQDGIPVRIGRWPSGSFEVRRAA